MNKPSIGFEDVEDAEAGTEVAQTIELSEDQVRDGQKIPLRFVRFQNVNSLHVSCQWSAGSCWAAIIRPRSSSSLTRGARMKLGSMQSRFLALLSSKFFLILEDMECAELWILVLRRT